MSTKIKLRKDAPWNEVTLSDGYTLNKVEWKTDYSSHNIVAVQKWVEVSSEEDELATPDLDFSSASKADLLRLCERKSIPVDFSSKKEEIVARIENALNVEKVLSEPVVEEVLKKPRKSKKKEIKDPVLEEPVVEEATLVLESELPDPVLEEPIVEVES